VASLVHPQSELIREPRLLVPRMVPVGRVRLSDTPIARKATHVVLPGYFRHWVLGKDAGRTTVVDVSAVGTPKGLFAQSATTSGDYQFTPAFDRKRAVSVSVGIYGNPAMWNSSRQDVYKQLQVGGSATQCIFAFNAAASTGGAWNTVACWYYSGGIGETVDSASVDGNYNCWVANLPNDGSTAPTIYCNGANRTQNATASATVIDPSAYDVRVGEGSTTLIGLAATFSPMLTPAEAAEWTRDPFSLFIPA
jgi:hypothetical protein